LIADLFSIPANVWALTQHELVCHHSDSEVISSIGVIFTAKDLRCHVSWGSTGILVILLFEFSTNTEICDSKVSLRIKHDVLGFDIAMDNLVSVQVFECYD
jgi:hypothetical protein